MKIYTMGFNGKSAAQFFEPLRDNNISRLLDIRLNNTSQLAAFTKKNDLEYFMEKILGAEYHHLLLLAPPKELLDKYKSDHDWDYYEIEYNAVLRSRDLESNIDRSLFDRDVVLLCSEETADKCHRRLAAEFLMGILDVEAIVHL